MYFFVYTRVWSGIEILKNRLFRYYNCFDMMRIHAPVVHKSIKIASYYLAKIEFKLFLGKTKRIVQSFNQRSILYVIIR